MSDLYELLGVDHDASPEDIKRAYRQRAREYHPDAGGDEETFKAVTHAYRVLSDPQKRARYDRFGDDDTPASRGAGDPFGFGGGFGGLGDVIDAFFGTAFAGGAQRQSRTQPGRDVLVPIDLTLEEVAAGVRRPVEVEIAVTCDQCGGGGSTSGSGPVACQTCGGAGAVQRVVRTAFGQLASSSPCPACQGTGVTIPDPCSGCGGDGRRVRPRTITVDVPPGVDVGDRLRVAGGGEAGRGGGPSGDLYVEIRVAAHPVFQRSGRDLSAEARVPLTQAALGATLTVPTVDGDVVEVDLPAGTQPGDVLRVRRAGLPPRGGGQRGDLLLHVMVDVPADLDTAQRDLVRQLAELRGEDVTEPDGGLLSRLRDAFR